MLEAFLVGGGVNLAFGSFEKCERGDALVCPLSVGSLGDCPGADYRRKSGKIETLIIAWPKIFVLETRRARLAAESWPEHSSS